MTLVWRPGYGGAAVSDPDAQAYLQAVEVADNQALEQGVQQAVNQFVIGCKNDGIWDAIKASCILAGARTLDGALVPLVGTAPTNYNFVAGDYDRKTGLKGDGSTKYLDSNRSNSADPQDSFHLSVHRTEVTTETAFLLAAGSGSTPGRSAISCFESRIYVRLRSVAGAEIVGSASFTTTGLVAASRDSATNVNWRGAAESGNITATSQLPLDANIGVFSNDSGDSPTSDRIAFYSIGESLDLAALDTRVSALITAIGAAIP